LRWTEAAKIEVNDCGLNRYYPEKSIAMKALTHCKAATT
jgi:hypothetical protein